MRNFLIGLFTGIVLASIGFSGLFRVLDKSVDTVKEQSARLAR